MRLRRETGDYTLAFTESVTSVTVPATLKAEDFLGAIINNAGSMYVVTNVTESRDGLALGTADASNTYTYTVLNSVGSVTVAAAPAPAGGAM